MIHLFFKEDESMIQHIDSNSFKEIVLDAKVPVLVDFYADWCGPCKMMTPVLESVSEELGETALIVKINVDQNMDLAQQYRIINIPAMYLFKDGEVVEKIIGAVPKDSVLTAIRNHL